MTQRVGNRPRSRASLAAAKGGAPAGANLAKGELVSMIDAACNFMLDGATVVEDQIEMQSPGISDRIMTCRVDCGDGSGS